MLRISIGWYFFYAGLTKVLDPSWSALAFLSHATTFPDFYAWFATPAVLPVVNILNSWGLLLIGLATLSGIGVRIAGISGIALMVLYYFPHENTHTFVVDDHVIVALAFAVVMSMDAGGIFGLKGILMKMRFVKRSSFLKTLIT